MRLDDLLETLDMMPDRSERIQLLIETAGRFRDVSPDVATRPFDESHRVPGCESEAFVWRRPGGFEFAVENPQGISAKALAVILQEGLEGSSTEEIASVPDDVVYRIFGRELSMGKSMGLMGMVQMVKRLSAGSSAG